MLFYWKKQGNQMGRHKKERHIIALSGGKDSAALAVYMKGKYPHLPLEYVFTDSGHELPETYSYLKKISAILNIEITIIRPKRSFEYWLKYFGGVLPSANHRWCTRLLKLKPYSEWLSVNCRDSSIYSYVGFRADEDREGFRPTVENFYPQYPFITEGITLEDVKHILTDCEIGLPDYYKWRSRSGCFFCFYQTDDEWIGLKKYHPNLFERAMRFEEHHSDGRVYTWRKSGYLRELTFDKKQNHAIKNSVKRPLLSKTIGKVISKPGKCQIESLMKE